VILGIIIRLIVRAMSGERFHAVDATAPAAWIFPQSTAPHIW
jgi:hypothetical protein